MSWARSRIINSDSQGMGRIGETDPPHVAARPRDERLAAPRRPGLRLAETRTTPRDRRQRAGPALPGQDTPAEPARVHGVDARGRLARARSPGRPGPVGARVVRREAGGGDEGRASSPGGRSARATHRCTARSPPGSVPIGAAPASAAAAPGDHLRLGRRAGRRDRRDARDTRRRVVAARGHARHPAERPDREHRRAGRSRCRRSTEPSRSDGRVLAVEPVSRGPA